MASMSKSERAKEYLKWLVEDRSYACVQRIVSSLDSLVYSESRKPVSNEYKISIVELMQEELSETWIILEHSDNQSILQLIQAVKAKIESEK